MGHCQFHSLPGEPVLRLRVCYDTALPIYGRINSVYMPILEFTILVQFWIYGDHYNKRHKIAYLIFCVCMWTTLLSLNLGLKLFPYIQWVAIGLWCVETFPQVMHT